MVISIDVDVSEILGHMVFKNGAFFSPIGTSENGVFSGSIVLDLLSTDSIDIRFQNDPSTVSGSSLLINSQSLIQIHRIGI